VFHQYSNVRIAVAPAMISSVRTERRTFAPAEELITLSMLVVGALTTALFSRSTVELDAGGVVVVGGSVVVVARVVVARVVARAVGGGGGSVAGGGAAVVGTVVVATVVVDDAGAVDVGATVDVGPFVDEGGTVDDGGTVDEGGTVVDVPANAGPHHNSADASTSTPNPVRVGVLRRRRGRITAFLIGLKR
jgi:hypothetical protein